MQQCDEKEYHHDSQQSFLSLQLDTLLKNRFIYIVYCYQKNHVLVAVCILYVYEGRHCVL